MQKRRTVGRKTVMLGGIATKDGLGRQYLDQAAQSTHEGDLAGLAVFVRLPAS